MAFTQTDKQTGGVIISTGVETAGATASITLLAPATGQVHKILWVSAYSVAATAADIHVTKNDATTISRIGGVGTGVLTLHRFADPGDPRGAVTGYSADQTKVVLTTTAGTSCNVAACYVMVPA